MIEALPVCQTPQECKRKRLRPMARATGPTDMRQWYPLTLRWRPLGWRLSRVSFFASGKSDVPGMKKKPSTSELLDWLKLLLVEDIGPETLRERDPKKLIPPLHGALLKNEQDVHLFERLAFLARREGRT